MGSEICILGSSPLGFFTYAIGGPLGNLEERARDKNFPLKVGIQPSSS